MRRTEEPRLSTCSDAFSVHGDVVTIQRIENTGRSSASVACDRLRNESMSLLETRLSGA